MPQGAPCTNPPGCRAPPGRASPVSTSLTCTTAAIANPEGHDHRQLPSCARLGRGGAPSPHDLVSGSLHGCWRHLCGGGRGRGHRLDANGCDAMAVHFFYYKTPPLIVERLAACGHLLQP